MSGNCIYVDDGDGPSVSRTEVRRARKPHRCCECGDPINAGSLHEYATGCWEGYWSSYRTCARCANLWREYGNGGVVYGGLLEYWQEAFGFDYRAGIPKDFAPCGREG